MKQLQEAHGLEGVFPAYREMGQMAFEHAEIVIECSDGYTVFRDVRYREAFL